MQLLSRVWFLLTPWTTTCQVLLSISNILNLLKLMSIESVMPSDHFILCHFLLLLPLVFPSIESFPLSWLFELDGHSTGASALTSVLPMNIQGWFLLGLTGLISMQFKRLSRVLSNATVWKHQFFSTQPSSWFNSYICTCLLKKIKIWLYRPLLAKCCLYFLIHCLGLS